MGRALQVVAVLVVAMGALGACAAASPGAQVTPTREPSASGPRAVLSLSLDRLDRLEVTRTDAFPQNHIRFVFPATVTAIDPAAVRAVASALLLAAVSLDATGRETVHGFGAARRVARSPEFWRLLDEALHLAKPGYATFRGSRPGG